MVSESPDRPEKVALGSETGTRGRAWPALRPLHSPHHILTAPSQRAAARIGLHRSSAKPLTKWSVGKSQF